MDAKTKKMIVGLAVEIISLTVKKLIDENTKRKDSGYVRGKK